MAKLTFPNPKQAFMSSKRKELPGPENKTVTGKKIAHTKKRTEGSANGSENTFIRKNLGPLIDQSCVNQIISSQENGRRVVYGRPRFF